MGERTRELLGDRAVVRPLGTPELKGKSPVPVYELLELRDEAGATSGVMADPGAQPVPAPRKGLAT